MRRAVTGELASLTLAEMRLAINESNLGDFDTRLANLYYIDQLDQIEVAVELDITRKTVFNHIKRIRRKMINTAHKLHQ